MYSRLQMERQLAWKKNFFLSLSLHSFPSMLRKKETQVLAVIAPEDETLVRLKSGSTAMERNGKDGNGMDVKVEKTTIFERIFFRTSSSRFRVVCWAVFMFLLTSSPPR